MSPRISRPRGATSRLFLGALAAILALGILAVVLVSYVTRGRPSISDPPPYAVPTGSPQSPPPPPSFLRSIPPEVIQSFRDRAGPPPAPVVYAPPPPGPPEGSWEAVPAAARAAAMGPIGAAVGRELNELHDKVAACFDDDVQARHGGQTVTAVKGFASIEESNVPVLMLELETTYDGVRVVDAPVEIRANAQDGLIACAQGVLRGRTLPAPGARPGTRYRLMYQLIP